MVDIPEVGNNNSETQLTSNVENLESIGQGPLALILRFLGIEDIGRASLVSPSWVLSHRFIFLGNFHKIFKSLQQKFQNVACLVAADMPRIKRCRT